MGKDAELLEAARNGNFQVVEKILSSKAKRSGPLARWVELIPAHFLAKKIKSKVNKWSASRLGYSFNDFRAVGTRDED